MDELLGEYHHPSIIIITCITSTVTFYDSSALISAYIIIIIHP
jgi:hypothetical protein